MTFLSVVLLLSKSLRNVLVFQQILKKKTIESQQYFFSSGDAETAASFARQLLALGADPNLRSRWTNMRALHYAAYFDVPQLVGVVLQASQPGGETRELLPEKRGDDCGNVQCREGISISSTNCHRD